MNSPESPQRRSLSDVMAEVSENGSGRKTLPTGFPMLDRVIGGGLRTRNLTLVGGAPGIGKTITTLQWARNIARDGSSVVFACYEHDEATLLNRLMHLELAEQPDDDRLAEVGRAGRRLLADVAEGSMTLAAALVESPVLGEAYRQIQKYSDNLWLLRASGSQTTLDRLAEIVEGKIDVLFVDYIQKVPLEHEAKNEKERIVTVSQGLKEIAMKSNVAVVAVSAADKEGLESPRLRSHHLRGSSAIAYEADIIILLNNKFNVVSRSQLTLDLTAAEGFKRRLIFSIEKNREGADMVDLEFAKQFEYLRVDPKGQFVSERLIDERIFIE